MKLISLLLKVISSKRKWLSLQLALILKVFCVTTAEKHVSNGNKVVTDSGPNDGRIANITTVLVQVTSCVVLLGDMTTFLTNYCLVQTMVGGAPVGSRRENVNGFQEVLKPRRWCHCTLSPAENSTQVFNHHCKVMEPCQSLLRRLPAQRGR